MLEDYTKPFKHIAIHADQIPELVGLDGKLARWWVERDNDFLHLVFQMEDGTGYRVVPGGYVEQSSWNPPERD